MLSSVALFLPIEDFRLSIFVFVFVVAVVAIKVSLHTF